MSGDTPTTDLLHAMQYDLPMRGQRFSIGPYYARYFEADDPAPTGWTPGGMTLGTAGWYYWNRDRPYLAWGPFQAFGLAAVDADEREKAE